MKWPKVAELGSIPLERQETRQRGDPLFNNNVGTSRLCCWGLRVLHLQWSPAQSSCPCSLHPEPGSQTVPATPRELWCRSPAGFWQQTQMAFIPFEGRGSKALDGLVQQDTGCHGWGRKCLEAGEHWEGIRQSPKKMSLGGVEGRG